MGADGMELDDDGSQGSDKPITVVETATGKVLSGDDAPILSQLQQWLEMHPGWEVAESDYDSDDEDGKHIIIYNNWHCGHKCLLFFGLKIQSSYAYMLLQSNYVDVVKC